MDKGKQTDEIVGRAVSEGLSQVNNGVCPSVEEIACLCEGTLKNGEKDRIIKHVSACDECYEAFRLSLDMTVQKSVGDRYMPRLRSLALAASIFVAVLSVYLFYSSGIKEEMLTPLLEHSRQKAEKRISSGSVPDQPAQDNLSARHEMKKDEERTRQPAGTGQGFPEGRGQAPKKVMPAAKDIKKEEAEEIAPAPAPQSVDAEKSGPGIPAPVSGVKRKIRGKNGVLEKKQLGAQSLTDSVRAKPLDEAGVLYLLNQVEAFNTEVKAVEYRNVSQDNMRLFRDALYLSVKINREISRGKSNDRDSSGIGDLRTDPERFRPLFRFEGDTPYLAPDIHWFVSRSEPGTAEKAFFDLALSGWYFQERFYKAENGRPSTRAKKETLADQAGFAKKVNSPSGLLEKWELLRPGLTGIYRRIAQDTIAVLKKSAE